MTTLIALIEIISVCYFTFSIALALIDLSSFNAIHVLFSAVAAAAASTNAKSHLND